ncbi:MAG: hypothetical protein RL228_334, partial [Actinomycetota bacterium]
GQALPVIDCLIAIDYLCGCAGFLPELLQITQVLFMFVK